MEPIQILTNASLVKGQVVYALIINYSAGGHHFNPHCFVERLMFDGLDADGKPKWLYNEIKISNGHVRENWVPYQDNDNFFVVGILPSRLKAPEQPFYMNGKKHWKDMLKITDVSSSDDDD